MAGYREFRPGEVWFYYNPNATKELERRKELGFITSRPVVIIQHAFYPEWSDSITVVPMTTSDRRSGIHIDTTILNDGSLVEGGTILPYIFYNIKVKYLHPMATDSHGTQLKTVSISDEDFDQVRMGVAYHMGFSHEVPEYVEKWRHLNDFDRSVVVRSIRAAVTDLDKSFGCPILQQIPDSSTYVENHVNASMNHINLQRTKFISGAPATKTDEPEHPVVPALNLEDRPQRRGNSPDPKHPILFMPTELGKAADMIIQANSELPVDGMTKLRIFPGSTLLRDVPYREVPNVLTPIEAEKILGMTISDIVENTGAKSSSTASRIRLYLKDHMDEVVSDVVDYRPSVKPFQDVYHDLKTLPRFRLKRNARRFKILFSTDPVEMRKYCSGELPLPPELSFLSHSDLARIEANLAYLNPAQFNAGDIESVQKKLDKVADEAENAELNTRYFLWDTLSTQEISEIASTSKRNLVSMAKKYGINKAQFGGLRSIAIELCKKNGSYTQTEIDLNRQDDACKKVISGNMKAATPMELLIFCRTEYATIAAHYGGMGSAETPSKKEISELKRTIRRSITKK